MQSAPTQFNISNNNQESMKYEANLKSFLAEKTGSINSKEQSNK